jgi:hypothetical protein
MSPETRDFLATVRSAEDPSPVDEARVLAALESTIAGSPTNLAPERTTVTKGGASIAGSGLKVVGALLGVSVGAALVAAAVSSGPTEPTLASRPSPPLSSARPSSSALTLPSAAPPARAPSVSPAAAASHAPHLARPRAPGAAPSSSASLREEIALLAAVQAALERGDGAEALRRLDGHDSADRQFVAERRAARIGALCLLGRVPEAQELAAVFFRDNAQSIQRLAVERSCAATKTSPQR